MDDKEFNKLKVEMNQLIQKNNVLEENVKNLLNEKERMNNILDEYKRMVERLEEKIQIDSDIRNNAELKRENDKFKNEIASLINIVKTLQFENEFLKKNLQSIKSE